MRRLPLRFPILLYALLLLGAVPAKAFEEINSSYFGNLALDGYDAVSYFAETGPLPADKQFTLQWKGATWQFASESNLERFAADPGAYAPRYDGYCSNQMSLGYPSDIDAQVWRLIDGKLYLFGHEAGRVRWSTGTERHIPEADRHWRGFLSR